MMEFAPILRAMRHNKTGPVLITFQIALTLAVVTNALFMINTRLEKMSRPVGIDAGNIINIGSNVIAPQDNMEAFVRRDLQALRAMPGVVDVTPILTQLQSGAARATGVRGVPEPGREVTHIANVNFVDEHGLKALGVDLIKGRNFRPDEVKYLGTNQEPNAHVAIITESLGKALFGEENPLGKHIYDGDPDHFITVIGVINDVAVAWLANEQGMFADSTYNFMLEPFVQTVEGNSYNYVIRTEPGLAEQTLPQAEKVLYNLESNRLLENEHTQQDILARSYGTDRAITRVLLVVAILMVAITAFGIVGLASFNVNRRRRQIGIRRALGATRSAILGYFVAENLLLTSLGIGLGIAMTWGFQVFAFNVMHTPKMPFYYIPAGVVVMYLLGLLAVYGPARRASLISPAVATRSV